MALAERDPNVTHHGRTSRASNLSGGSRGPHTTIPTDKADMLASAPGVMSMLRSSTEMGNDALFNPPSRFNNASRPRNRQSGTSSRLSNGSGHSSSRRTSTHHSHQAWPSVSSAGRRRSITSNISNLNVPHYLDTMPPSLSNLSDTAMMPPGPYFRDGGGRSFSLTHTSQQPILTNYRSLTSLRGHDPFQRPRSPYKYPTRLKRPGYRPSSPALSDVTGVQYVKGQHMRLGSGLRVAHGPGMPPIARPAPLYATGRNRSSPSVNSAHSSTTYEPMPGAYPRQATPSLTDRSFPIMTPSQYPALHYSNVYPGSSREPTPSLRDHCDLHVGPETHNGLQVPGQSSSNPPSSSPSTPRDLPSHGSSEPTIMPDTPVLSRELSLASTSSPLYYDYSEQYDQVEKQVLQVYNETTSAPIPLGFVQRIKTILEERATIEQSNLSITKSPSSGLTELPAQDVHELPATPIIKRITREFILANLDPDSDFRHSLTPTVTQILGDRIDVNGTSAISSTGVSRQSQDQGHISAEHQSQSSVATPELKRSRTNSTTDTGVLDFAMHNSIRSTMSFEGYVHPSHVRGGIELPPQALQEATEPVTIAIAELEVTSPTPTQPWTPRFQTALDLTRPQSALMSSSVYSSSHKDSVVSRHSTPTTRLDWPLQENNGSSGSHSHSTHVQRHTPQSNQQEMTNQALHAHIQQRSSSDVFPRVNEAPHTRCQSGSRSIRRLSDASRTVRQPAKHHTQHSSDTHHSERRSGNYTAQPLVIPTPPPLAKLQEDKYNHMFPTTTFPTTVHITVQEPTQVASFTEPSLSTSTDPVLRTTAQKPPSPVSPLSPADGYGRFDSTNAAQLSNLWSYRKPVPNRSSSPVNASGRSSLVESRKSADSAKDQAFDNSTTDLRFSTLRPLTRQLDDVKEEPGLECSSVDLRSSTFRFPLPQRKSSLAHFESLRLSRESRQGSVNSQTVAESFGLRGRSRTLSGKLPAGHSTCMTTSGPLTLADMREIPSLNFSHVDLFAKLNDALELRHTDSCDQFPKLSADARARPRSSGLMREKYKSFFQTLDGMTNDMLPDIKAEEAHVISDTSYDFNPPRNSTNLPSRLRPMSADELMAELDRISIPSIHGLTQRLSELLPSLKRYYGETGEVIYEEDETVRSAIDEIRKLGHAALEGIEMHLGDEDTIALVRSGVIAGLLNSPEDSVCSSNSNLRTARPRSASSPGLRSEVAAVPAVELEATPVRISIRSRSLSDSNKSPCLASTVTTKAKPTRISDKSVRNSPTARPWNVDANYPWANNVPNIDIGLPTPTLRRSTVTQKPSKLRLRMSREPPSDLDEASTEIGSMNMAHGDPTESTTATVDTFEQNHKRKTSKRSILGSFTRRIGLGNSFDQTGFPNGPDILRGEDRIVDPGDRYPTTGLSPPSALNIDEVRSFFSDDSSAHRESAVRGVSFRKRLTNLRTRMPMARAHSAMEHRCPPPLVNGSDLRRSNSLFVPNNSNVHSKDTSKVTLLPGAVVVGMPKTEFRAKKLVERMKTLWYKGGELLRSLSHAKKKGERSVGPGHADDWENDGESAHWIDDD